MLKPENTTSLLCHFDADDLKQLRRNASKMKLDAIDLVRAGMKMVLPIKTRKEIIRILYSEEGGDGSKK